MRCGAAPSSHQPGDTATAAGAVRSAQIQTGSLGPATNPSTTPQQLEQLAKEDGPPLAALWLRTCRAERICWTVSPETVPPTREERSPRNPNCEPRILRRLAGDRSSKVRWRVAANTSTPSDVLERLAQDMRHQPRPRSGVQPVMPSRCDENASSPSRTRFCIPRLRLTLPPRCLC